MAIDTAEVSGKPKPQKKLSPSGSTPSILGLKELLDEDVKAGSSAAKTKTNLSKVPESSSPGLDKLKLEEARRKIEKETERKNPEEIGKNAVIKFQNFLEHGTTRRNFVAGGTALAIEEIIRRTFNPLNAIKKFFRKKPLSITQVAQKVHEGDILTPPKPEVKLLPHLNPPQEPMLQKPTTEDVAFETIMQKDFDKLMERPESRAAIIEKRLIQQVPVQFKENAKHSLAFILEALHKIGAIDKNTVAFAAAVLEIESGNYSNRLEINAKEQAENNNYDGGLKYAGRGYIQLTGIDNYQKIQNFLKEPPFNVNLDLVNNPDIILKGTEIDGKKITGEEISAMVFAAYFMHFGTYEAAKKGDFIEARATININEDMAVKQKVASRANDFLQTLSPIIA